MRCLRSWTILRDKASFPSVLICYASRGTTLLYLVRASVKNPASSPFSLAFELLTSIPKVSDCNVSDFWFWFCCKQPCIESVQHVSF